MSVGQEIVLVQVDNIILLDGGVSVLHQLDNCALICWLVLNPSQSTLAVHKLVGFHLARPSTICVQGTLRFLHELFRVGIVDSLGSNTIKGSGRFYSLDPLLARGAVSYTITNFTILVHLVNVGCA